MSYIIQATTRSPLLAWSGKGKVGGGIDPLAPGKPVIHQLFIPGLQQPDLNKAAILVHAHGPLNPKMSKLGERKKAALQAQMLERMRSGMRR